MDINRFWSLRIWLQTIGGSVVVVIIWGCSCFAAERTDRTRRPQERTRNVTKEPITPVIDANNHHISDGKFAHKLSRETGLNVEMLGYTHRHTERAFTERRQLTKF
ncbi:MULTISPECIES: hypothetical protein [unclassified Arthrobacter]|uniref:hypothetical protein n=1 Tax=unclassified Arthrobacter TaxID=235627 RepID=UPI0011B00BE5|nr:MULTISPECIES: hypothetical protein [unclassified Arthrobacter]